MKKNLRKITLVSAIALGVFAGNAFSAAAKVNAKQQQQRIVYGVTTSPYTLKILVALREKGLPYDIAQTYPLKATMAKGMKPSAEFMTASPLGKIPAYQEDDWSIADSAVIMAYLDKANPEKPLYPTDAKEYAQVRWFEKYGDEVISGVVHNKILFEKVVKPIIFKKPTNQKVLDKAINEELPAIFDYLETSLADKKWITGNKFTAADIAIAVHFVSLKKSSVTVDIKKWPNLVAYIERMLIRDSFSKT